MARDTKIKRDLREANHQTFFMGAPLSYSEVSVGATVRKTAEED